MPATSMITARKAPVSEVHHAWKEEEWSNSSLKALISVFQTVPNASRIKQIETAMPMREREREDF